MKRNNKKGFTIVELVIVIAVIAILAAVLIPTFSSIIKKAKVNNDIQLVRNLNTALATDTKEHKTMQSALDAAFEFGYDVAKINNTSVDENKILWDSVNDVFCYLKDGALEYVPNSATTVLAVNDYRLWTISDTVDETYSTYYTGSETTINTSKGFDAGTTRDITAIEYKNTTGTAQKVVIRTNGEDCVLTINAPSDTVAHYGFASKTNVEAVDKEHCYNENGTSATLVIKSGKVVLAPTAVVFELKKSNDFDSNSTFENNGGFVAKADAGTLQEEEYIANIYNIGTLNQLEAFREAVNSGMNFDGITIKLTADITLNKAWRPISNYSRTEVYGKETSTNIQNKLFKGTFDGQGHTIYGLTNVGVDDTPLNKGTNSTTISDKLEVTYGLFASIGNATIKDLKLADVNIVESFSNNEKVIGDCVGAVTGFVFGSATFENITVSGSVVASDNVGGLVGRVYNNSSNDFTVSFNNCTNNATVKSTAGTGKAAGIACLTVNGTGVLTVNFNNCTNTATIETNNTNYYAGIAYNGGEVKVILTGCTNTGSNTSGRMYYKNESTKGDNGNYN